MSVTAPALHFCFLFVVFEVLAFPNVSRGYRATAVKHFNSARLHASPLVSSQEGIATLDHEISQSFPQQRYVLGLEYGHHVVFQSFAIPNR